MSSSRRTQYKYKYHMYMLRAVIGPEGTAASNIGLLPKGAYSLVQDTQIYKWYKAMLCA